MDLKEDLLQLSINFWIKELLPVVLKKKILLRMNQQNNYKNKLIRKLKKRKVQSPFIDNIWGANLADMLLINKFNKGIRFLLFVIDIYSKYNWLIPLKGITIINAFQKILEESNRKPNKIWVDKGSKFYNSSMKSQLEKNDIKTYSTHNEGKSVVAERFIRTLKHKIYKYMTSISKNVYIDKLDDKVNKCNNTYHKTIKMKPVDAKPIRCKKYNLFLFFRLP